MKISKKTFLLFFNNYWPQILLILITVLFFWKFFILGHLPIPVDLMTGSYLPWLDYKWGFPTGVIVKNPITSDVFSFIYPMQSLLGLWNPLILSGSPLLANFQSASFSPTKIFYFIFNSSTAWSLQIVMQHIIGAISAYILLRHWSRGKLAAVLGGILYSFSGYMIIWSEWNTHSLTAAWLPLIVLFSDRFIKKSNIKDGCFISIFLTVQLFSGYPQLVLYTIGCIYLLYLIQPQKKVSSNFLKLSFFIFLGVCLSAIQTLPGYELLQLSQRQSEVYTFEWAFLPWSKIITFIAPDYFGNHTTYNYWGPLNYTSNIGFVGVIGMLLATVSLSLVRKNKVILFAVVLVLISLCLSFPTPLAVLIWKSGIFGLNAAAAHRILFLFTFGISVLSAFGLDQLLNKKFNFKYKMGLLPLVLIFIFGIAAIFEKNHTSVSLRNLIFPCTILLFGIIALRYKSKKIIAILLVLELFRFGWKYMPFSSPHLFYPATPLIDFLQRQPKPFRVVGNIMPVNTRMVYKIESFEGYDAVYPQRTAEYIYAVNNNTPRGAVVRYAIVDNYNSRLLDIANTKYFLIESKNLSNFDQKRFREVFTDKSSTILENLNVLPRQFIVNQWEIINDKEQIIKRLLDSDFDYKNKIILEEKPSTVDARLLFVSDSWYPGWKVYVNGVEQKIYRANYMFRAVEVPEGNFEIEFTYQPDSFKLGTIITLLTAIALFLLYFRKSKIV